MHLGIGIGIGFGGGGFAPVPGLGDLSSGMYRDFTLGRMDGGTGPAFSLTRASASTTVDHEGLVKNILSGEARFRGLRRVENLLPNQDWTLNVGQTSNVTVTANTVSFTNASAFREKLTGLTAVVGRRYTVRATLSSTDGKAQVGLRIVTDGGSGATTIAAALSAAPRIYTASITASGTPTVLSIMLDNRVGIGGDGTTSGTVTVNEIQIEETTGQAITAPSEYVSKGVLSSPWHGAGVDGVKYFTTQNGNTVASNVVTEATGAALTLTGDVGIRPFGAHTNLLLRSEELDNAAWTKVEATISANAVAAPDGTTTADKIVENGANAQHAVRQAATSAGPSELSVFVKAAERSRFALFMAGSVNAGRGFDISNQTTFAVTGLSDIGSGAARIVALANGWYRCSIHSSSATDRADVYLLDSGTDTTYTGDGTSGIYVWGAMLSAVRDAPYVKTTSATVTVAADVPTASGTGVINATEGTLWVEAVGPVDTVSRHLFTVSDGTNSERIFIGASSGSARAFVADGGATQADISSAASTWTSGTVKKAATRYRLNDVNLGYDGVASTADTTCTMPTTTTLTLGTISANSEPNTTIRKVALSRVGASDANLALATAP